LKLAERSLLPAIRDAGEDELIIASGFSCREQIEQGSARKTLHAAEVLAHQLGLEGPDYAATKQEVPR
jgi:hypothetical protein